MEINSAYNKYRYLFLKNIHNVNKKLLGFVATTAFLTIPLVVLAVTDPLTWITGIVNRLMQYIVWPIFIGACILMFIYAGFMFVTSHGDPAKIKSARDAVLWAVIGVIVVIFAFSAYTIIRSIVAPVTP